MRLSLYAFITLFTLIWNTKASGYEVCTTNGGTDIKWLNPDAMYYINNSGGPSGTIAAVQKGMQTWTDVATSEFVFEYGGATSSAAHGINDGSNIVTFGILPVGTVAENRFWYKTWPPSQEGEVLDSDVRFNTYYAWSTTGASGHYDVQNVGTHEHGHSLCLSDLYGGADNQKTMYGYVSPGEIKKQTLAQDDIDGITYLYTCPNLPASIEGTPFEYDFLQDAYDNAAGMNTIQSQATVFDENLLIDMSKPVYVKAGYDCTYANNALITTLNGNMTITDGILIIQSGTLKVQ